MALSNTRENYRTRVSDIQGSNHRQSVLAAPFVRWNMLVARLAHVTTNTDNTEIESCFANHSDGSVYEDSAHERKFNARKDSHHL